MCVGGWKLLNNRTDAKPMGHFDKMRVAHGIVRKTHKRVVGLEDKLGPMCGDHLCRQT